MIFDVIVMNPPYNRNLHLRFLKKCLDIINKDTGNLVYIAPDNWLTIKYPHSEKSNIKKEARDKYSKYIDELETFTGQEFNKYFGTSNWFGVSIFKMNYHAKGINTKQFESNDELVNKVIKIIIEKFTSLRSHFSKNFDKEYFVPVRLMNHSYLNWVERDKSKTKAKHGILFNSKDEMNNFITSFDTWLYKFLNCTDWVLSKNSGHVPYLDDYSKPWTNERLYKLFNITDKEKEFIENEIKEKSKW